MVVMVVMVMVIIPASTHGPHQEEEAAPPPAAVLHGLSSLHSVWLGMVFSTTGLRLTLVRRDLPGSILLVERTACAHESMAVISGTLWSYDGTQAYHGCIPTGKGDGGEAGTVYHEVSLAEGGWNLPVKHTH